MQQKVLHCDKCYEDFLYMYITCILHVYYNVYYMYISYTCIPYIYIFLYMNIFFTCS